MKKGFTLVELLVVIVIIGALAAIAIPQYTRAIEQSRRAEAVVNLDNIRKGAVRYYQLNGTYAGLNNETIDIDWPPSHYFSYWINQADPTEFRSQANRTTLELPSGMSAYNLQIDQNGNITEW